MDQERFALSLQQGRKLRAHWRSQRANSKLRQIQFLLSFEEWLQIWIDSGKLHLKGCRKGQYVMARFGDVGPYSVDNVRIIPQEENHREYSLGRPMTELAKSRLSTACQGRPSAFKGRKHSESAKMCFRKPKSEEHRKKLSAARKQWWLDHPGFCHSEKTRKKLSELAKLNRIHERFYE